MKKAYLIMATYYDSMYVGGYTEHPYKVSFDKSKAEKWAIENTNVKTESCGCCRTGISYDVEEIEILEDENEEN